jgi:hypothetical protein
MSIKAIRPDKSCINFDIPEHKLMQYERDIKVFVPEGQYPKEATVRNWCKKARIKCVEV